ncbi:MAG: hypothetical protein ACQESR_17450 [Planctomycetota bacterium]
MESCPTQAVLPLVGLAAEKVIRDQYRIGFSDEWDRLQTSVRIDPRGDDPRIWCKMWRWVRSSEKPDIALGDRREREPASPADG